MRAGGNVQRCGCSRKVAFDAFYPIHRAARRLDDERELPHLLLHHGGIGVLRIGLYRKLYHRGKQPARSVVDECAHTVHIAMTQFAEEVNEKTNGRVQVKIFPNGQLGSENENLEQLQAGVIAMTKVSAPGLATYNEAYNAFGLPYIFKDTEDFYHVMDSQQMQDFFLSTGDDGFVTLTYYTSGARSFYTKDRAIRTPADLKGLKIRVQDMKSQTDMMNYLGGIPVAMSYGDVYTSLQTGIIDGTENNETALTTGKHGEVCKVYSVDQHAMIPDVLIMSEKVWKQISPEDQEIILEAAHNSTEAHKVMWDTAIEEAVKEAQETMGVEFVYDVD